MRILLISAYHPAADAPSSGPKLVAREIAELQGRGHEVTLVSFENELDLSARPEGFSPPSPPSRLYRLSQSDRMAAALRFPHLPLSASARPLVAGADVRALLASRHFDEIRVEFIQGLEVIPRERWHDVTLVAHDILTQLYERRVTHATGLRSLALAAELIRVRNWEREAFRRVGRLVTLNEKDRDLATRISGRGDIDVRYPSIVAFVSPDERTPASVEPRTMLYWGHMARAENVDAVVRFATEMLPSIKAAVPDARLVVAGIDPPAAVRRLAGPDVEITGFLADPAAVFRRAALGVVPLRLGAGIKIKTLEMLACGMPVVATTVGAEGVRPSPLLTVADGDDTFVEAVVARLLGRP